MGALADLLAASVNANVGKWDLSPVASEIEAQTARWLAELVRYPADCGGWGVRTQCHTNASLRLTAYASRETHTWIEKAAAISGLGTAAIRWIDTDDRQRISMDALRARLNHDRNDGFQPFLLVGTAGNVSTGAIDPLAEMAELATMEQLWFHVDGAYGAPVAMLDDAPADLQVLARADSVALDPHKWLYSLIEAACTLVRQRQHLLDAFAFQPPYYDYADGAEPGENYYALGL